LTAYPIDRLLPQLCEQLQPGATVLLQAPPGAGKTTRVPLALIGALSPGQQRSTIQGRIWMIEPRRLAVRAAATRLADTLGEALGERIGFSVRGEKRRSSHTQIEVLTDGLFLRRLQADPELQGVDCVLFDEFHERRRDAELGLTLLRDARAALRPELPLMLMSATLDLSDLTARLPEALVLESAGRSHPVDTLHQPPRPNEPLTKQVLRAIEQFALALPQGSGVLVFLPGLTDINRCQRLLEQTPSLRDWQIAPLHGQLPLEQQSSALRRCEMSYAGKVILSSAISESSVTLDGVRLVIDSGLSRQLRYDPNTGMEGLETVTSSLASAEQRRGRAGRQGPGTCIRLWSPANQQRRPAFSPAELQLADPQPVVIELAAWGAGLGKDLPWLEPPPLSALNDGRAQLIMLKALTKEGCLSATGRQLSRLGVHPRLGLLMLTAQRHGCVGLGCDLAALLSERDPWSIKDVGCDLDARLRAMHNDKRFASLRQLSQQLRQQLNAIKPPESTTETSMTSAELIVMAFPEWLALKRSGQPGRFQLRQGRGAVLHPHDPLIDAEALAVARVDLGGKDTRIQLAVRLDLSVVERLASEDGHWQNNVVWDEDAQRIRAERILHLGQLQIRHEAQPKPPIERCRDLLLKVLEDRGTLDALPWTAPAEQLRRRLELAHLHLGPPWPARDLQTLLETAPEWLGPFLEGCLRWRDLDPAQLQEALWGTLDWHQRQQLDQVLPTHVCIPSGRSAALRYEQDHQVILAVKLQEMFGCDQGPSVLNGTIPVTLELLSPAGRALQRTSDLAGFWNGSYAEVRREMRGRYPKHPWPETPQESMPTAATKHRR